MIQFTPLGLEMGAVVGVAPITGIPHLKASALDRHPGLLHGFHSSFSHPSLLVFDPLPLLAVCSPKRTDET